MVHMRRNRGELGNVNVCRMAYSHTSCPLNPFDLSRVFFGMVLRLCPQATNFCTSYYPFVV